MASGFGRTASEKQAPASHSLMRAIENGDVNEVRLVLAREMPLAVLTEPSLLQEHGFRTPLMAAVKRGDRPILTALVHRIEQRLWGRGPTKSPEVGTGGEQKARDHQMRTQLEIQDDDGMNLAMLAARCGNLGILKWVMAEIHRIKESSPRQVTDVLDEVDDEGRSVLMHAAIAGSAPVFQTVYQSIVLCTKATDEAMIDRLTMLSSDGRTILMHAARARNAPALFAVVETCRSVCDPRTVRQMLYLRDTNGMNFLMHSLAAPDYEIKQAGGAAKPGPPRRRATLGSRDPPASAATTADGDTPSSGMSNAELGEADVQPPDPAAVPVFNRAMEVIIQCLWKIQRREQLNAKDVWKNNALTHAISSGNLQLVDDVLTAVHAHILDSEFEEMLDTREDEPKNTPLLEALFKGGKRMRVLFAKKSEQLQASLGDVQGDIGLRAKLSSIEAKIQSFIPGKLIVIFQLLLPETNRSSRQLVLLVIMCALAPPLNWVGSMVTSERPNPEDPRGVLRGVAITSTIGEELGWNESLSAALLAVATIVIPAVDAFFNTARHEVWYEKLSCQKQVFIRKANHRWLQRKHSLPFNTKANPPKTPHGLRNNEEAASASPDTKVPPASHGQMGGTPDDTKEDAKDDGDYFSCRGHERA
eukprot:g2545.t1